MSDLATCPFCKFSHLEYAEGHPHIYTGDWSQYAPVEIKVLGHAAIECKNCGIVVVDTNGDGMWRVWNILKESWSKLSHEALR